MVPRTCDDWHCCLTQDRGIALTRPHALERIAVLEDERHPEILRPTKQYGDAHRRGVLGWYKHTLTILR